MKKLSFETFNKVMAAIVVVGATFMAGIGVAAWACMPMMDYQDEINTCSIAHEAEEGVGIFDDMYFSTEYVVDRFWYNGDKGCNNIYFIMYDDLDAGCDNEIIKVDRKTFELITDRQENGRKLTGTLKGYRNCETVEYKLEVED